MPDFTGTKDFRSYLAVFWRWKFLFLAFLVAVPIAGYLIDRGKPKVYRASALVGINGATVGSAGGLSGGSFSTSNVNAIAELVTTSPVAQIAARLMHPPAEPGAIAGEVSASPDPTTGFLTISAEDRSPARAGEIANAFASAIGVNLQAAQAAGLNKEIRGIQNQLNHLPQSQVGLKAPLQAQLTQLQSALATQASAAAILQPAGSGGLVSGSPRRVVEIGLLIGLLLGIGAIVLAENADRRLRSPDDLEKLTGLPMLAAIAPSAFAFSGSADTNKADDEAFQMLRTALMYFNVDRPLKSVIVTSPGEKDGKTTVATRLALVTAGAGLNVVLMDADLRRAQVSSRLGLNLRDGLGSVIAGEITLADGLIDYPVDAPGQSGQLRVLPAGPPPPNPSALISSESMQQVLRQLESDSDLVIIDTPAALAVSDPLPLMRSVTGVVLVARMNRTTKQMIRRLQKIIDAAHGSLVGVVATGVSSGPGYEHYYPAYYTGTNGNGSHAPSRLRRFRKVADEPTPHSGQEKGLEPDLGPKEPSESTPASNPASRWISGGRS